jgi:hypothetical protein
MIVTTWASDRNPLQQIKYVSREVTLQGPFCSLRFIRNAWLASGPGGWGSHCVDPSLSMFHPENKTANNA